MTSDRLLNLLACPDCGHNLQRRLRDEDEQLKCEGCKREYPVRNGVPRLLPKALIELGRETRTASHFTMEFNLPERSVEASSTLLHYLFLSRTGLDTQLRSRRDIPEYPESLSRDVYDPDASALSGLTVLDAGCGGGRFLRVAAETAEHVVGLELGEHVEVAAGRAMYTDNIDVVQGSVLAPPFKLGAFDLGYSLGVIHHTPNPRRAAVLLGERIRAGGDLALWVYSPAYWGGPVKKPIAKLIHAVMSRLTPSRREGVARAIPMPIGRLQVRFASRRLTKALAAPLFVVNIPRHDDPNEMLGSILDYYGAPIISTHDHDEVVRWLDQAGFTEIERLAPGTACLGRNRALR